MLKHSQYISSKHDKSIHSGKSKASNLRESKGMRVVSPRLVTRRLGASGKIVELNQEVCKGKEITYFVKIYPSEASPSWAMAMVG